MTGTKLTFPELRDRTSVPVAIVLAGLCLLGAAGALGNPQRGDDDGDGPPVILCERGLAYSPSRKSCLDVFTGGFAAGELLEQGTALARAGHYGPALDALRAIGGPPDARVLTMIGYAERKRGRVEEGIRVYLEALALDPENVDAREYLGEGYVETGRVELAREQLARIEAICGSRDCEAYRDLEAAIAAAGQ